MSKWRTGEKNRCRAFGGPVTQPGNANGQLWSKSMLDLGLQSRGA